MNCNYCGQAATIDDNGQCSNCGLPRYNQDEARECFEAMLSRCADAISEELRNPSATPRTDAATIYGSGATVPFVEKTFAQGLEREIAGLRVALAAMGSIAESNAAQEQAVRLANQIDEALELVNKECPAMDDFKNIVPTVAWLIQKWRECRKVWSESSRESSRLKVRVSELQDALDLDLDEFSRIHAIASQGYLSDESLEVKGICERAKQRTWQLVPVFEQLESAKKEIQRIRDALAALIYTTEQSMNRVSETANYVAQIRIALMVDDKIHAMHAVENAERMLFDATCKIEDLEVAIESAKEALK